MSPAEKLISAISVFIINPLIGFLIALALLFFLWGLFNFIRSADSDEGRTVGKQHMFWGIVGLFVMLAVLAILRVVTATFGVPLPGP